MKGFPTLIRAICALLPILLTHTLPAQEQMLISARDGMHEFIELGAGPSGIIVHLGDSIVEQHLFTSPNDTVKVIVQFASPPMARAFADYGGASKQARDAYKSLLETEHGRFLDDLARIESRAKQDPDGNHKEIDSQVHQAYYTVLNGVALLTRQWVADEIGGLSYVLRVDRDELVKATLDQSVPTTGATALWETHSVSGKGLVVGIIDTGIDYMHPDLGGGIGSDFKVMGGYNFVSDNHDPKDDQGHGTHVAGTVAANGQMKGVAPDARLMAYKVLDEWGYGDMSWTIAALEMALEDGVHLVNISLGGPGGPDSPGSLAVDNATAAGLICVVAAGNNGSYLSIDSPGSARKAITVGAISHWDDAIAWFSSKGPVGDSYDIKPDLLAPGVHITAPFLNDANITMNGTSMATPHVAGGIALLLEMFPDLPPDHVKSLLMQTAADLGMDVWTQGVGRMDLVSAAGRPELIAMPSMIGFGLVDLEQDVWVSEKTVVVLNDGTDAMDVLLDITVPFPPGALLEIIPSQLSLPAGERTEVVVRLTVDNRELDFPTNDPPHYAGSISLTSGAHSTIIPLAFVNSPVLRIQFEEEPASVFYFSEEHMIYKVIYPVPPELNLLLPKGKYDIRTAYYPSVYTDYDGIPSFIIREDVMLDGYTNLHISKDEAKYKMEIRASDGRGGILYSEGGRGVSTWLRLTESYPVSISITGGLWLGKEFRFSHYENWDYFFEVCLEMEDSNDIIILGDHLSGSFGDHTFTYDLEDIHTFEVTHDNPAYYGKKIATQVWNWSKRRGSGYRVRSLNDMPFSQKFHVYNGFRQEPMDFRFVPSWHTFDPPDHWDTSEARFTLARLPYITLDHENEFFASNHYNDNFQYEYEGYKFQDESFRLMVSPPMFNGQIIVSAQDNRILIINARELFVFQMRDYHRDLMPYRLWSNGQMVKSGHILDDLEIDDVSMGVQLFPTDELEVDALEVDYTKYMVHRLKGLATARYQWNPQNDHYQMPFLRSFNILADGTPTDLVQPGKDNIIRFTAYTGNTFSSPEFSDVLLEWRLMGDADWQPLGLEQNGSVFQSAIPSELPEGYISLRIILSEEMGSSLAYTVEPAFLKQSEAPLVRTVKLQDISSRSAVCYGEIIAEGSSPATTRGMVWHTEESPSLDNNLGISQEGTGLGTYSSTLSELSPATTYYVSAYATYGDDLAAYGQTMAFTTLHEYALTYQAGDNGSITGETTQMVPHGGSGTQVEAVPDEGYHFVEWSDGLPSAQRTDTEVTADITVTALFAINQYTIEASVNNEQYGSVSGGGEYEHGATATLLATSLEGTNYIFVNWTENGTQVHDAPEYVFEAASNRSLVAHFQNVTSVWPLVGTEVGIRVFPVPAVDVLHIESRMDILEVRIFDVAGRQRMRVYGSGERQQQLNLSALADGMYFIHLLTPEGLHTRHVLLAR